MNSLEWYEAKHGDAKSAEIVARSDVDAHGVATLGQVEAALATALERASAAEEWATVAVLARELEARRAAREAAGDVVIKLDDVRRGRT